MTHEHDPLEAELRSLRPAPPSLEFHERIAAQLAPRRTAAERSPASFAFAAGLIAASLLVVLFAWRQEDSPRMKTAATTDERPSLVLSLDKHRPTAWNYHRAIGQAPDQLEALLSEHAQQAAPPDHNLAQVRGFVFSQLDLRSLLGEM